MVITAFLLAICCPNPVKYCDTKELQILYREVKATIHLKKNNPLSIFWISNDIIFYSIVFHF